MEQLWVERYRPTTLDDYVWRDKAQRAKVEEWIATGSVPHLMLTGAPGTGKTTLAKLILHLLGVQKPDILDLNASRDRNVEVLQRKIISFVQTVPFGDSKYVLLDEADYISPYAQGMLRNEIERYSDCCRFILTCNYPDKIIPAIHSRCQSYHFEALDRTEFMRRILEILDAEGIELNDDFATMELLIEQSYPDLRKCINLMQQNCRAKQLIRPQVSETIVKDYVLETINLFNLGRYKEARTLITKRAQPEEYPDLYRYFYRNLQLWCDTEQQEEQAIIVISDAIEAHNQVADAEINFAACLVKLTHVKKGQS